MKLPAASANASPECMFSGEVIDAVSNRLLLCEVLAADLIDQELGEQKKESLR